MQYGGGSHKIMADKSTAVMWIIGIAIYYVGIIALLTFASGIDSDISFSDGGFTTIDELRSKGGSCGYPKTTQWNGQLFGRAANSCQDTFLTTNDSCSAINGCTWSDERWFIPLLSGSYFGDVVCKGLINVSYYNDNQPIQNNRICEASALANSENLCEILGCSWTDFSKMSTEELQSYAKPTPRTFLNAIAFLSGFRADFGFDGVGYAFIVFLLFYIPLLLLIASIYLLVPFI